MFINEEQITNKLKSLFADVFDIQEDEVEDESSPDTIKSWDSLKHLQLILTLEDTFNISITADETTEILSFSAVKDLLSKHLLS
jgi:acyl carrier protein